jgi:hypothetical protein
MERLQIKPLLSLRTYFSNIMMLHELDVFTPKDFDPCIKTE